MFAHTHVNIGYRAIANASQHKRRENTNTKLDADPLEDSCYGGIHEIGNYAKVATATLKGCKAQDSSWAIRSLIVLLAGVIYELPR